MRKQPTQPAGDPTRPLVTRRYLAVYTGRNPETVSRHCRPVACDVRNRALLYAVEEAVATLAALRASRP